MRGFPDDTTFAFTPTSLRVYLPIVTYNCVEYADLHWAVKGRRVFLHLERDPDSQTRPLRCPSYRVGDPRLGGMSLNIPSRDASPDGPPSWMEVLIRLRPLGVPDSATSGFIPAIPMHLAFDAPVRFPEAGIRQFMFDALCQAFDVRGAGLSLPWMADSKLTTTYIFSRYNGDILIRVGQCQQDGPSGEHRRIWATVSGFWGADTEIEAVISKVSTDSQHDCSKDHILQWPDLRKRFELNHERFEVDVTLSFTPCPLNPERTLILEASYRHICSHTSRAESQYLPGRATRLQTSVVDRSR